MLAGTNPGPAFVCLQGTTNTCPSDPKNSLTCVTLTTHFRRHRLEVVPTVSDYESRGRRPRRSPPQSGRIPSFDRRLVSFRPPQPPSHRVVGLQSPRVGGQALPSRAGRVVLPASVFTFKQHLRPFCPLHEQALLISQRQRLRSASPDRFTSQTVCPRGRFSFCHGYQACQSGGCGDGEFSWRPRSAKPRQLPSLSGPHGTDDPRPTAQPLLSPAAFPLAAV
ncbi:unnamed protein product [Protopolystoma xenopodis]|uniref:Uncharacterized protein n=1 Tax=Protopolystoma xenopodis TaxID=117903 RepID=A0A3S5BYW3_9PLAT|nr:unnamed protein product [Protopolystoma xenopodis]